MRRSAIAVAALAATLVTCAASGAQRIPPAAVADAAGVAGGVLGPARSGSAAAALAAPPSAAPTPVPVPASSAPPAAAVGSSQSLAPTASPTPTPPPASLPPSPAAKIVSVEKPGAPPPSPSRAAAPGSTATAASTPTAVARHVDWGVYEPQFPGDTAAVDGVESMVGRHADIVMWYAHWGGPWAAFRAADVEAVLDRGSTPLISWMSDDPSVRGYPDVSTQTAFTDAAVASGRFDSYIRSWATGLRDVGRPVMLRLDFEMNGSWQAWSPGVNGQTAQDFVAMWRHVHDVFASEGATNVEWVWCPNVSYPGSTPLAPLYPGDAYVDRVGIDGYNWGTSSPAHAWQSFPSVFDTTIAQVTAITSRPMMVCEVASTELGGSKAAWIHDFFAALAGRTGVVAFVWFDADKETDWRIASSAASEAAFVAGLRTVT